jgi:splicing factor 3B subunit 2
LKGYRNSVPVPKHWAQKKRYLQGKRGVDKKVSAFIAVFIGDRDMQPFELPDFIQATGIAKLREGTYWMNDQLLAHTRTHSIHRT